MAGLDLTTEQDTGEKRGMPRKRAEPKKPEIALGDDPYYKSLESAREAVAALFATAGCNRKKRKKKPKA